MKSFVSFCLLASSVAFGFEFMSGAPSFDEILKIGNSYTREEFKETLNTIYSDEKSCEKWIEAEEKGLLLKDKHGKAFLLPWKSVSQPQCTWRTVKELPAWTQEDKPLQGIRISIDPGHIGGAWAKSEAREHRFEGKYLVREGTSTLITAQILRKMLEAKGAKVQLVRNYFKPCSQQTPAELAKVLANGEPVTPQIERQANQIFHTRIEINARARKLRAGFHPDFVICLHFDATADARGGDNALHGIVNGSYLPDEIADDDTRTAMVWRLLTKAHDEELALSKAVLHQMVEELKLPARSYAPSASVRPVNGEPYLWRRNLLANNLYPCPVIYLEPYAMNNTITARRLTLGSYEGTQVFDGKRLPCIYHTYAQSVTNGLCKYFSTARKLIKAN